MLEDMGLREVNINQLIDKSILENVLKNIDMSINVLYKKDFIMDNKINIDLYNNTFFNFIKKIRLDVYNFLKDNYTINSVEELYNLIYNKSSICDKCGGKLEFIRFNKGYRECENCYKIEAESLDTKEKIIDYINNAVNTIPLTQFIYKHPVLKIVFSKFPKINTEEELYLFLYNDTPHTCEYCGKKTKFVRFRPFRTYSMWPYHQFCSSECRNKWWSLKQREDNTIYRANEETLNRVKNENSIRMKQKIKNGDFTPCSTNSWCHSKYKIKFIQNNKLISVTVRSSWEAIFQLLNPTLLYEKLRVQYIEVDNKLHNYIVDFIDIDNKIVYEVKPDSCKELKNNILKNKALINWCKANNYNMQYIDENYFKTHNFNISLLDYTDDEYKQKLLKLIKRYKTFNISYEN